MTINGFEMIRLTAQAMLDAGVDDVIFVVGRKGERVEAAFSQTNKCDQASFDKERVFFVRNPDYAATDMFHSVQLGLLRMLALEKEQKNERSYDAMLVVPGDMPAISPNTIRNLLIAARKSKADKLAPMYQQRGGHPLLAKRTCFEAMLLPHTKGGLRKALEPFTISYLNVEDKGILLDADTQEAFDQLASYVQATKGVSDEIADELFERFGTPPAVRAHCSTVAAIATRMAERLNVCAGFSFESTLARSAALLHDLNRLSKNHAQVAAQNLQSLGYSAIANVVCAHQTGKDIDQEHFTISNIVFLADKLVCNTEIVSPGQRYSKSLARFADRQQVTKRIMHDQSCAEALLERYIKLTGDDILAEFGDTTRYDHLQQDTSS